MLLQHVVTVVAGNNCTAEVKFSTLLQLCRTTQHFGLTCIPKASTRVPYSSVCGPAMGKPLLHTSIFGLLNGRGCNDKNVIGFYVVT